MSEAPEHRIEELEERIEALENEIQSSSSRSVSGGITSFLSEVEPANHYQRSVTIGYYLLHEKGQESFDVNDIEEGYNECRISKPVNFSDVLSGAEEKGWIMRYKKEGQKQLWKITPEGDDAVEGGFGE